MKVVKHVRLVGLGVYAAFWLGGVASYLLLGGPPPEAAWSAPVFLALAAMLVAGYAPAADRPVLLLGGLFGFGVEALGVATGFPFGGYAYTEVLYPRVFGVPLVLGAAWLVLFAYVRQKTDSPWWGAAWMTALDLVIDPLAAHRLGFWTWESDGLYYGIPWTNFAGWFGVSLVIFLLLRRPASDDPLARGVGLSVLLFFTVIALGTGLWLAGAIGVCLVILDRIRPGRARRRSDGSKSREALPVRAR